MVDDRRAFSRVPVQFDVTLTVRGKMLQPTLSTNLSMAGVYVEAEEVTSLGDECHVTLHLNPSHSPVQIEMLGRVSRVDANGFAVVFQEVDLEGYHHLCNIVRYNADDVAEVETEIRAHIGLKPRVPTAE